MNTPPLNGPHLAGPAGTPRARALGIGFGGIPGRWNAVTDVAGVEVGYRTIIAGESVRTGVTAICPRGRAGALDPVAAGYFAQNGNGELTGAAWIEESGTFSLPVAITNTHAVGIAHAGIISWAVRRYPALGEDWALPVAARDLGRLSQRHQRAPRHRAGLHRGAGRRVRRGAGRGAGRRRHRDDLLRLQGRQRDRVPDRAARGQRLYGGRVRAGQLRPPGRAHPGRGAAGRDARRR